MLRHVQQAAGLGVYVMEVASGRFATSDILDEIFGITKDYPCTKEGWVALIHPDDRQMIITYLTRDVLGSHRRFNKEFRIIRLADGVERWVHGYGDLEFDQDNHPVYLMGTVQDISDRKRVERALQMSETRFRELIDLAVDGILIGSHEGFIIDANRFMSELTGMSRAELIGKPIGDVLFTRESLAVSPLRFDLFQKGETVISERQLTHTDGSIVYIEIRTKMMPDGTYQSIYRDITERKVAEKSLLGFTKILAQRMEERTKELEGANTTLKHNVKQLQKLTMELTQAEELERKRLASILHDHVQQYIAAAMMKVSLLDPQMPAADHALGVKDVLTLLGEALAASRSLTVSLCPPVLLEAGLMPGLHWLAGWMTDLHGLTVKVTGEPSLVLPGSVALFLFQGVRELLFNVVKHSGVLYATVSVSQPAAKTLKIIVVDQGKGFLAQESNILPPSGGFGLFHLRERLTFIGGALEITNEHGQGTRASITVSL